MTTLDERYDDLLNGDDDPALARLVAELGTLREGSLSQRGDMTIRHALAVRAQHLALQRGSRVAPVGRARQRRWTNLLQARFSVAFAALAIVLLSVGTYLHGQGPTPVSAQTVLHRAAAAGPGPNQATHATYRVSSSDGSTGTAEVWIGYDGSGTATQLALTLSLSQKGHPGATVNANLVAVGLGLVQVYNLPDGSPGQIPAPPTSGSGSMGMERPVPATPGQAVSPTMISSAAYSPARAMKGIVVGTLLAQKLGKQPDAYKLEQETLNGVPVYALQPASAGNVTYYFNAQSYVLQGADWMQDGSAWQARLDSYRSVPLSAVPTHTFGAGPGAGRPSDTRRIVHVHATQHG